MVPAQGEIIFSQYCHMHIIFLNSPSWQTAEWHPERIHITSPLLFFRREGSGSLSSAIENWFVSQIMYQYPRFAVLSIFPISRMVLHVCVWAHKHTNNHLLVTHSLSLRTFQLQQENIVSTESMFATNLWFLVFPFTPTEESSSQISYSWTSCDSANTISIWTKRVKQSPGVSQRQ